MLGIWTFCIDTCTVMEDNLDVRAMMFCITLFLLRIIIGTIESQIIWFRYGIKVHNEIFDLRTGQLKWGAVTKVFVLQPVLLFFIITSIFAIS